jgi:peroxiredoxin
MRFASWTLGMTLLTTTTLSAGVAVGDKLAPFSLKDQSGRDVNLASYKDKKALVLIFVATRCPVSNAYNARMATLAQTYAAKGVALVGINANREETPAEIAEHAQKHGLTFPILKDTGNVYADRFGAHVTPEAYVYDQSMTLRYHGRIDDDRAGQNIQSRDLEAALDAVLSGKAVPVAETKAFGCTIKRQ